MSDDIEKLFASGNASLTLSRALAAATEFYEAQISGTYDYARLKIDKKPESPIEEAMMLGLVTIGEFMPYVYFDGLPRLPWSVDGITPEVVIYLQHQIDDMRVDFFLDVRKDGKTVKKIVIECDGHNFHERTKQQAARDRSRDRRLSNMGYAVLRFTGSEIYNDLLSCIHDIVKAIGVIWQDYK